MIEKSIRYLLGTFLVLVGFNKLFPFFPPMSLSPQANSTLIDFAQAGFIIPLATFVEISSGILLFSRRTSPFAALMLFPLAIGLVLFHLTLDPQTIFPALLVLLADVYLITRYSHQFEPIFWGDDDVEFNIKPTEKKLDETKYKKTA